MELVLILGAFVALDIAALRWGRDSRDCAPSSERDLARFGMVWDSVVSSLPKRVRRHSSSVTARAA